MVKFNNILLILSSYVLASLILPILLVPIIILLLLPESQRLSSKPLFFCLDIFYKAILRLLFVPIRIQGKENIPHDRPAIIIANHQSSLDAPILGSLCDGYPQMWFSLTQYAQVPFLGFFLRRLGVPLNTADSGTAAAGLLKAIRLVKNYDRHTLIFPEGGRYNDGKIHPFLKGFVIIAKITGRPVIPVFLADPGKILPPHSVLIRRHRLTITVGAPCVFDGSETEDAFAQKIYDWFVTQNNKK